MKNTLSLLISLMLVLSACAPKPQDRKFAPPLTSFGPRNQDTNLGGDLKQSDLFVADLSLKGRLSTSVFFHQARHMMRLSELTGNEALRSRALAWMKSFYSLPQMTSTIDFAQSPFATLATTQTQSDVQSTLTEVHEDLQKSRGIVKDHVLALGAKFPLDSSNLKLQAVLDKAGQFTKFLLQNLVTFGLSKQIEDGLRAEIIRQTDQLFSDLRGLAFQLYATKSFSKSLQLIEQGLAKFQIQMPTEFAQSFQQGRLLATEIDNMDDAQGGLTVLVDVWKILEPKERELNFKAGSEALYDFLSKQDSDSLNCLRKPGCNGGLFKGIAKKLFILPQINKYGIGNLQKMLNEKTLAYVVNVVEDFARKFMLTMPQTFADQLDQGLDAKDHELQKIQSNYPDYLKQLLADWSKKKLQKSQGKVAGFEVSALDLNISEKAPIVMTPAADPLNLDSTTAGASIGVNALMMDHLTVEEPLGLQRALSQINKLITIGGYRDDQNKLVPALLSPVEAVKSPLDLMDFSNASAHISYRIPDRIKLLDSFHADDRTSYDKSFSAAGFAEQIEGLSLMLQQTADWKKSGFDTLLGGIQAQDLTTEVETDALKRSLFPKDSFFALNLGDVAVLLKDITKRATPVFLVTLDKNIVWADQYNSMGNDTAIMAGIVDIVEGQKSNVVQSRDVAKFLISLTEFLKATEGAENTRSSLLLEKDKNGESPIDALKQGRSDVKLLVVALANFISNQLVSENALIQEHYYLHELQRSNNPSYRVEEQVYAIRSLLAAWEITGIEAYLTSAKEIYFSMNRQLFDGNSHFYANGDGRVLTVPEKVHTLVALQELRPYLPEASQQQLDKISAPWIKALQKLQ